MRLGLRSFRDTVTDPSRRDAERFLSPDRYRSYLAAGNADHDRAISLYEWNVQISSALFEVVHYLEVALRSAIDATLRPIEIPVTARIANRYGWWFNNPGFVTAKALEVVHGVVDRLGPVASGHRGRVLASLSFGL